MSIIFRIFAKNNMEIWKKIEGFLSYKISNKGNV